MNTRFIPTHQELIQLENLLTNLLILKSDIYKSLQAEQSACKEWNKETSFRQTRLCQIWNDMLICRQLLNRFEEYRHQDFDSGAYLIDDFSKYGL